MSSGVLKAGAWVVGGLLVLAAGFYVLRSPIAFRRTPPVPSSAAPVGDLPIIEDKQDPLARTLDGCPAQGEGGDPELNVLKNRVDPGNYVSVSFDSLTTLTWPKNIEREPMALWPEPSRAFISQFAGLPISVEGYIVGVREGPPDSANCNWDTSSYLDWHLSFAKNARDARALSVLAEVTPRVRINHRWTLDVIHSLIMGDHIPVRLSGWLYFDPEHPGDLGVTRSTLWEINPVMQIQILDKTRWVPLDGVDH